MKIHESLAKLERSNAIFSEFKKIKESFYKIVKRYKFKKIEENVWKFMKINDDYQEIWTEIWVDT